MNRKAILFTVLVFLAVVGLLEPVAASAAIRFGPPTLMMMNSDNKVAVGVIEAGPRQGTATFKRLQAISGKVPEEWTVRIDPEAIEGIAWNRPYVVAYTEVRRNPLDRETRELDPDGPRVLILPVIGAALLEDTPEARFLFEAVRKGQPALGRDYVNALMVLLARPDVRTRRFVIVELYLRQDLYQYLQHGDVEVLRDAVASDVLGSESRAVRRRRDHRAALHIEQPRSRQSRARGH